MAKSKAKATKKTSRALSATVDLNDFTHTEFRSMLLVASSAQERKILTDEAAIRVISRLERACARVESTKEGQLRALMGELGVRPPNDPVLRVSKLERHGLVTFLAAARQVADFSKFPTDRPPLEKLAARLQAKRGRRVKVDAWPARSVEVERVTAELRAKFKRAPVDQEVEVALGVKPGSLRLWRHRRPELFGA